MIADFIYSTSKASGRPDVEEEKKTCPRFWHHEHTAVDQNTVGVYLDGRLIEPSGLIRRTGFALESAIDQRFPSGIPRCISASKHLKRLKLTQGCLDAARATIESRKLPPGKISKIKR